MYTLIVKGDETAAFAACSAHKVEITSIVKHEKFDECIVTTPAYYGTLHALADWFCEPLNADALAPAGTLLWYGPRQSVPVAYPPIKGWDKVEGGGEIFHSRAAGADIDLDKAITGQGDQ
jgi:hypothetical protein